MWQGAGPAGARATAPTLRRMASESLWRSRLRWRWRGALQWPLFAVLTVADALLLGWLPIAGDGPTALIPALLLASFFNLVAVAILAPIASMRLRRRRPDLPKVIADDRAGVALLCAVTVLLAAGGLLHRPHARDAEHDFAMQQFAAREFAARQAPPEFRRRTAESNTLKLGDEYFRTCVPGSDPRRWFCVFVDTESSPPGITVDTNRLSNEDLARPAVPG